MIDKAFLHHFATKNETSFENVLREHVQHLFLRSFYTKKDSRNFLFKGGTALRLVFGSPRFSQDLDFTGVKNSKTYERVLEDTLISLSQEGISVDIEESKETTGGQLASIRIKVFGERVKIGNQVSFRPKSKVVGESVVISSDLSPSYSVFILKRELLIGEKLTAFLTRAKPRDFFDLYFILRNEKLRRLLNFDKFQREKIILSLEKHRKVGLERELKRFLPGSFWGVVKDLPGALRKEI